jgi:arachidonate 5-lipoxygenase
MAKNTSVMMQASVAPQPLPPIDSVRVKTHKPLPEAERTSNIHNLTFEGGGAKGYCYIGALQVLEEEGIYPHNIQRVAGTSVGSMFALLAATGCSTAYMLEKVPSDFEAVAKDGSGGQFRSFARAARRRGMHPGQKLYDFLGSILEDTTGSADITFAQLYERCGRELCIPVTNVSRMMTEYCHIKTTPNMPVRVATRMSMSLPVMLQPINLVTGIDRVLNNEPEVYVDGGLLCNNPIHVFDGWWLSMDPKDSFLRRMRPLEHASEHYPRSSRFSPNNPHTLGFTLVSADEADITRGWMEQSATPTRPSTKTALAFTEKEIEKAKGHQMQKPVQKLLDHFDAFDTNSDGRITRAELNAAIVSGGLSAEELTTIFGTTSPDDIFNRMNVAGDDAIDFGEVLAFLESIGLDVTTQLVGFPARPPKNMLEFALNMLEAVTRDLTRANQGLGDRDRIVPIDTDYVGTTTFDLVQADLDFMVNSGRNHTKAFLSHHR